MKPAVGIGIVLIIVAGLLKRRRQKQIAAAAIANGPIMSYAPQGPNMMPSTYDPSAPPQSYPFNSYGQNVGGPVSGLGYRKDKIRFFINLLFNCPDESSDPVCSSYLRSSGRSTREGNCVENAARAVLCSRTRAWT